MAGQLSQTVQAAVAANGRLLGRLGHPVAACPFNAAGSPRERMLARLWVRGHMAAAPPAPGDIDYTAAGRA